MRRKRLGLEAGQSLLETVLMVWLLTLLISAIIQVFLIHNYAFQMANNAYYAIFKDKAYRRYNDPDEEFRGWPNWPRKPLRTVKPLQQAGGLVHELENPAVNWTSDDRASVPMMPFFQDSIVETLRDSGITRDKVRLKIGNPMPGHNYLDMKFFWMAMGTEGGFNAFITMIEALIALAPRVGRNYTDFTGYDEDFLRGLEGRSDEAQDELGSSEDGGSAQDSWDEHHGDHNHDGYNDWCESVQGDNDSDCKNDRPWE